MKELCITASGDSKSMRYEWREEGGGEADCVRSPSIRPIFQAIETFPQKSGHAARSTTITCISG